MVIGYYELSARRFEPDPHDVAFVVVWTARRETIVALEHTRFQIGSRRERQISLVPASAIIVPFQNLPQFDG
jgi:hypothetical protein